jgi:chromosome segregation ATPase
MADENENDVIRGLREANRTLKADLNQRDSTIDSLKTEIESFKGGTQTKITQYETQLETLTSQLQEAQGFKVELETERAKLGKYEESFKARYEETLKGVPDEHKERVSKISGRGDWNERFETLADAIQLIPTVPSQAGTITNPGTPPPPTDSKPALDMSQVNGSFAGTFKPL